MKRTLSLAVVVVLLIVAAPAAFAEHCERCRPSGFECIAVLVRPGHTECFANQQGCWSSGIQCDPHTDLASFDLSTDYTVASIERLDEPDQPADETRVALLAATPPSR
jgi:hypothetical protein